MKSGNIHLSRAANLALRGLSQEGKKNISTKINTTVSTFSRWLKSDTDLITKASVIKAISEETGIPVDLVLSQELVG